MRFTYCPDCGRRLGSRVLGDEGPVPWCVGCERPWFDMFSCASIVLVVNDENRVALLDQSYISTNFKNLVSGYMKPGESAEECAMREVEEEIGIHMHRLELRFTRWFERSQVLMAAFVGYTHETALSLSAEVDAAGWFDPVEALSLVHPKESGSVSGMLVELFLAERNRNR